MNTNKAKRRKKTIMALSILGVILGMILLTMGICGIRWSVHNKTEEYGEYVFNNGATQFDLDLFPSIVIDADATELKVLQIADPQIKFGPFPGRDRKTFALLEKAIKKENPDICVVTGDLTLSMFTYDAYKYFADFMKKMDVPWALVYGNHDSQFDCSKYTLYKLLEKYDNCLLMRGPKDVYGESNYLVNVFKGEKLPQNLAYSLVMMDSGMYPTSENVKLSDWVYDWFHQDQIDWYNWAIDGLQSINPDVQTSMFFHIPLKEFSDMYYANEKQLGHEIPAELKDFQFKEVHDVTGYIRESDKKANETIDPGHYVGIFYQGKDPTATTHPDMFAAIKAQGSTKAVFCGHDHVNNMKGYYDGIYLAYGRCGGYHTYPFFNKFPSDKVLWNGSLWVDENGNQMLKGYTVISVDVTAANYGSFTAVDRDANYYNNK